MLLNYTELAEILSSKSTQEITRTVIDLRERIEVLHTSEYSEFLQRLYPILHVIITQRTKPQYVDNDENKCRHAILDLLYRFPHNDVLKPHVDNFLNMVMPVFADDNEENALTALRIIFDLHKFYRPILEGYAQPFLEQVQKILKNMPSAVKVLFTPPRPSGQVAGGGSQAAKSSFSSNSVHTSAQSMPGAIAVPGASPVHGLASQYNNGSGMGSGVNQGTPGRNNNSVSSHASNSMLLSSNMYLLGGTAAGAGVVGTMAMGANNSGIAESKEGGDMRLARTVSAPIDLTKSSSGGAGDPGPQLLLSQPNFPHSVQSNSIQSPVGVSSGQHQMRQQMSTSPSFLTGDSIDSHSNSNVMPPSHNQRQQYVTLTRSIDSFKVLAECPLIVMLLFQLYPKYQRFIPSLVPLMMNALSLSPAQVNYNSFRAKHKDLLAAQVKTLSLLTYLLRNFENRQFPESARPSEENIARNVVGLLRNCPSDVVSTRKEILVAIRHILNTNDFKKGFYGYADILLDEKLLLGPGRGANSVLRPMAYSTIADLVNHIKDNLTLSQLTKIVYNFSQNLHDAELPLPVQTTCVRLLFNVSERLAHNFRDNNPELPSGRNLLLHLIRVVINKFGSLRRFISRLDAQVYQVPNDGELAELGAADVFVDLLAQFKSVVGDQKTPTVRVATPIDPMANGGAPVEIGRANSTLEADTINSTKFEDPSSLSVYSLLRKNAADKSMRHGVSSKVANSAACSLFLGQAQSSDPVREIKQLLKAMIPGLKNMLQVLSSGFMTSESVPGGTKPVTVQLSDSEETLLSKYMCWTLECCFALKMRSNNKNHQGPNSESPVDSSGGAKAVISEAANANSISDNDIRELLDMLASVFVVIDPHHLRPVLAANLQKIYDYAVENQVFLSVIQQLLSYPHTAAVTLDTMLSFFISKIYDLSFQTINTSSSVNATPSGFVTINGFALTPRQPGDVLIFGSSCLIPPTMPNFPNYSAAPSSSASFMSSAKSSLRHGSEESDKLRTFKGQRASTLLRLFKMVLGSVKSFPENEKTLRPWLKSLITTCLKCAHECRISVNYLFVLRYLFMTISGGKFDMSYSEILPLFPLLLNSFNKLLCRTDHLIVQNVLLELCLTIPSRLTALSQHLPVLLHLLARALCTKGELPNLALRTLEFWVEHLNADCLHTAMTSKQGLMRDILTGICSHLKPAPYPYGMLALRVLGKLGGRNRNLSGMHNRQANVGMCDTHAFTVGELQTGANCVFPTERDRKSAVHLLVRKEIVGAGSEASSCAHNATSSDTMDVVAVEEQSASSTVKSDGSVYGIGIDNAIFRACELLDRLSTRSSAAESEVPSLLLSSVTSSLLSSQETSRVSLCVVEPEVAIRNAMEIDENEAMDVSSSMETAVSGKAPDSRKLKHIPDLFMTLLPSNKEETEPDALMAASRRLHSVAMTLLQGADTVDAVGPAVHKLLTQEIKETNQNTVNSQKSNSMKFIMNAAYFILEKVIDVSAEEGGVNVKLNLGINRKGLGKDEIDLSEVHGVEADVLSRIILAVVATFEDPLLQDDAKTFLIGMCTHLAIYYSFVEKSLVHQGSSDMEVDGITAGNPLLKCNLCVCVHRAIMSAFEDPRDSMYQAGFWLLNVWVKVTSQVRSGSLEMSSYYEPIANSHLFNVELNSAVLPMYDDAAELPDPMVDDLIQRAMSNCHSSKWSCRIAALRMISELCGRLPSGWCTRHETEIVQSVFDIVKQSGLVLMVSASLDAATVLKKLCASCHGSAPVTPPKISDGMDTEEVAPAPPTASDIEGKVDLKLLSFLVLRTFDASMLVRIGAKLYLRQIAAALNSSLSKLLAPIQSEVYQKFLKHYSSQLSAQSIEEKTGIMAGVGFLLSLPDSFVPIDETLFMFLNDGMKMLEDYKEQECSPPDFCARHTCPIVPPSVGITDWGDKTLNEYFSLKVLCLPSEIPTMVEFRLQLIHLIESFHTHSSEILLRDDQFIVDLRHKCFVLLFKSLVTHWDEVKTTSQTAVNSIIASFKNSAGGKSENALPKQVMNDCLQPLFGAIHDSRRLSLSTLKSLGVILKIVMHKFYVQFGDKFLAHLKHWLEPEKVMQPAIWAPGEEIVVAATMMDLFHVLPWNVVALPPTGPSAPPLGASPPNVLQTFFEQFVHMTIRLEAVRSKYRHPFMLDSPFLAPMSKFLYKFPSEGISYFLDPQNIGNPNIIRLLVQILKYSSVGAHPFLDKLSSPQAISMLRRLLLQPALPVMLPVSAQAVEEKKPIPAVSSQGGLPSFPNSTAMSGVISGASYVPHPSSQGSIPTSAGAPTNMSYQQSMGPTGAAAPYIDSNEPTAKRQKVEGMAPLIPQLLPNMQGTQIPPQSQPQMSYNQPMTQPIQSISQQSTQLQPSQQSQGHAMPLISQPMQSMAQQTTQLQYQQQTQGQLMQQMPPSQFKTQPDIAVNPGAMGSSQSAPVGSTLPSTFARSTSPMLVPSNSSGQSASSGVVGVSGVDSNAYGGNKSVPSLSGPPLLSGNNGPPSGQQQQTTSPVLSSTNSLSSSQPVMKAAFQPINSANAPMMNTSNVPTMNAGAMPAMNTTKPPISSASMMSNAVPSPAILGQGQKRPLDPGIASSPKISAAVSPILPGWTPESCVNGLKLLYKISCIFPKIYESNPDLTQTLRNLWKHLLHRKFSIPDEVVPGSSSNHQALSSGDPMSSHPSSRVGFRRNVTIHKALRLLTRCLLIVFNFNPDNVDILFEMLPILSTQCVFDISFFTDFLKFELPSRYSVRVRRNIIRRFLDVCRDPRRPIDVKIKGWQLIFIPLFLDALQNTNGIHPSQIFDNEIVETIMQQVLRFGGVVTDTAIHRSRSLNSEIIDDNSGMGDVKDSPSNQKIAISDALRIELLKVSALLIEHFGVHLVSCRKDVIKFAWNNLKSEDVATKHWAYVLVCRFIAAFETPSKIIFQVYFALLRIHQHDGKELIRMALDILVPVLPDRLKPDELQKVMRYAKRVAVEEGHSMPQLMHLWHIVIRHSDIFYPFRSYFMQLMVQSTARLGLSGTCPLDQRQVSVGIADVLVEWEFFRQQKNKHGKVKSTDGSVLARSESTSSLPGLALSGSISTNDLSKAGEVAVKQEGGVVGGPRSGGSNAAMEKELDFALYSALIPVLANFLVRLGLYGAEAKDAAMYRLSSKCLVIFRKMAHLVSMKQVRMTYFDRYFVTTVENMKPKNSGSSISGSTKGSAGPAIASDRSLETFLSLLSCGFESSDGPSPLFVNNITPLKDMFTIIVASNDFPKAQRAFRELIVVVLKIYPPSEPTPVLTDCGFYHKLKDVMDKLLRKYAAIKIDIFKVSSASDKSGNSSAGEDGATSTQRQVLLLNLLCLLRLLDVICIQTPNWVENHATAFTKLGQKLVVDHHEAAASNLRSGLVAMAGSLQEHGQSIETSKVQPTPHMALISEAMRGYPLAAGSSALSSSPQSGSQSGGDKILPNIDDSTNVLLICMNILCRGVSMQHLSDQKDVVVNLMLNVLESSDCVVLLGLVVDYLDKWIGRPLSPLPMKSQYDIVARLDNLDRLSEVLTQVLISRLVAMSERIAVFAHEPILPPPSTTPPATALPLMGARVTLPSILPRASDVFGLMSSHDYLRRVCTDRAVGVWGSSLYERFLGVFRADLRLHVNRYWPAVMPSVLLNCSDLKGCPVTGIFSDPSTVFHESKVSVTIPDSHPYRAFMKASALTKQKSGTSAFYEEMLGSIGVLSMTSVDACDVWKSLLNILWSGLDVGPRAMLANVMCENVAKHQYRQNLYWPSKIYGPISGGIASGSSCAKVHPIITPTNVPQSLLRAFLALEPRPLIPIEFMGAIGSHYGTWNDSCEVLESIVFSEKPSALVKQRALRTLLSLYNDIDDQDSARILSRLFTDRTATDIALSLENYGLPQIAQCVIWKGLREYNVTRGQDRQAGGDPLSSLELEVWENRWVESAKSLSQWDVLYAHADKLQMSHVAIEAAALRNDWDSVKRLRYMPSVVASLEMGLPTYKLFDIMQCVLDSRFAEADRLCALTVQMALFRWQLLPPITAGCNSHKGLLHLFHRVIELRESTGMIMEVTKPHTSERSELPDLKGMIETWRERLPDPRDGMYMWDTLLMWRVHVFQLIQNAVRNVHDASLLAALHDTPWTVVKLSHAANKRGLPDSCLLTLSKLDSVSEMDIPDCYNKLREQILVCLKSEMQWNAGLTIINSTNLQFFDWMQKSELFRLKAVFQDMMGLVNDAYASFSQSVQMCQTNGKSWYSWGEFCYKLYLMEKSTENAVSAMVPILKAVECNYDKAKPLLSRVIFLLATEDDILSLGNAFQICLTTLPEWVWIPHIPQLLDATRRNESNFVKPVLCRVAEKYPQAIYNHLAYYATEPNSTLGNELNSGVDSVGLSMEYFRMRSLVARDILDVISRSHKSYYHKVTSIFNNIANNLSNSKLETICSALILTIGAHIDDLDVRWNNTTTPTVHHAVSFAKLIKHAFAVSEKSQLFQLETSATRLRRERVMAMEAEFKDDFSWVFSLPTDDGAVTPAQMKKLPSCEQFAESLSRWIHKLESFIRINNDATPLSDLSPALADMFLETNLISRSHAADHGEENLEVPGGYQGCWDYKNEPSVNLHTKLVKFSPIVKIMKLNDGNYCRRLSIIGSDGEIYHFAVVQTSDQAISSMINFGNMCDWVNNGLRKSTEAYQRDAEFRKLTVIPLQSRICLVRVDGDCFSLAEALDNYWAPSVSNISDSPSNVVSSLSSTFKHDILVHSRRQFEELLLAQEGGEVTSGTILKAKLELYQKMASVMPTDALRNQIRQHCPTPDLYSGRSRSFAGQLGLHAAMSVFLNGSNEFKAENIHFSCTEDSVLLTGLNQFSKTGLRKHESKDVNFRLTKNISSALSPILVLGSMASCMGCLLDTLVAERASLEPLLCLILLESERMTKDAVDMANVKQRAKSAFDYVEDIAPQSQDISSLLDGTNVFQSASSIETGANDAVDAASLQNAPIDLRILQLIREAGDMNSLGKKKLSWMPWL